jgi:hypothetical protein
MTESIVFLVKGSKSPIYHVCFNVRIKYLLYPLLYHVVNTESFNMILTRSRKCSCIVLVVSSQLPTPNPRLNHIATLMVTEVSNSHNGAQKVRRWCLKVVLQMWCQHWDPTVLPSFKTDKEPCLHAYNIHDDRWLSNVVVDGLCSEPKGFCCTTQQVLRVTI